LLSVGVAEVYSIVAGVLTSGTMAFSVMRLANEINPDLGVMQNVFASLAELFASASKGCENKYSKFLRLVAPWNRHLHRRQPHPSVQ
jgi:DNA repair protein RadC